MYQGYNAAKGETYVECDYCHKQWIVDDGDADEILEPWPHIECPYCGTWIALF